MTSLTLKLAEPKNKITLPSFSSSPQFVQGALSIVFHEIQEAMDDKQTTPLTFDSDNSLINGMITLPCWCGTP
jgi:hypothetical protein